VLCLMVFVRVSWSFSLASCCNSFFFFFFFFWFFVCLFVGECGYQTRVQMWWNVFLKKILDFFSGKY
jgi:hypothetical protein